MVLEVDAAVEGGGDASVDCLTEDVTDGLFNLSVDSLVKIFIRVVERLFLLSTGVNGEVVVDFTCTSAIYWFAVALIEVPVSIHSSVVAGSGSVDGEVVVILVA